MKKLMKQPQIIAKTLTAKDTQSSVWITAVALISLYTLILL
jgi:hypothetical protein